MAGMIGWDGQGQFHTDDLAGQVRQALHNVVAVLAEAGAKPEHIVRMTWYVTDKREYLREAREIGAIYRAVDRQLQRGDDRGAGGRADRGPRQGGDRGHRGHSRLSPHEAAPGTARRPAAT